MSCQLKTGGGRSSASSPARSVRCVAVADAIPASGAQAALHEERGPSGLHELYGATAQRVGADLALLVSHAQRIPIPLPDPE